MKGNLEELTLEELEKSLLDSKQELRKLRFASVTSKLDNPKKIKELKKLVARILTLMRQDELGLISLKK